MGKFPALEQRTKIQSNVLLDAGGRLDLDLDQPTEGVASSASGAMAESVAAAAVASCGARRCRGLNLRQRAKPQPCGVGANAVDHGANPVGALRRQVLLEAESAEGAVRVDGKDLFGRSIGKKRDCDRD